MYEQQIYNLQNKLENSRRIVSEEQEKMKNAKKELLVLWKMEITSVISKKKENLELGAPKQYNERTHKQIVVDLNTNAFVKLKKASGGKHALKI